MAETNTSYADAARATIEAKGLEVLLDPVLFANCMRDVAGQSWSNEFRIAERNLDAAMLEAFYNAASKGPSGVQATSRRVANQLQFDCGLLASIAEPIAFGLGEAVSSFSGAKELVNRAELEAEMARKEEGFLRAVKAMNSSNSVRSYEAAAQQFDVLGNYKDSQCKARACRKAAETYREQEKQQKENRYSEALSRMKAATSVADYYKAKAYFTSLGNYKDSSSLAKRCAEHAEELYRKSQIIGDATRLLNRASVVGAENISENSLIQQIVKLESIGDKKDAETLARQIRKLLKEHRKRKARKGVLAIAILAIFVIGIFVSATLPSVSTKSEKHTAKSEVVEPTRTGDWSIARGALLRVSFGELRKSGDDGLLWVYTTGNDASSEYAQSQFAKKTLSDVLLQMTQSKEKVDESLATAAVWSWTGHLTNGPTTNWILGTAAVDEESWYYKVVFYSDSSQVSIQISDEEFDPPSEDFLGMQHPEDWKWQ